jgi:hypothetical protein
MAMIWRPESAFATLLPMIGPDVAMPLSRLVR